VSDGAQDSQDLWNQADRAMYEHKRAGAEHAGSR